MKDMKKVKDKIKELPRKTGIYIFKDKNGGILYIGKAKDLKKRVKSHFQARKGFFDSQFLERVKDMDWIETASENEALILEQQLIKRYEPRFNIEWSDDKNYFWIAVTRDDFPRIFIAHQLEKSKIQKLEMFYIGPFVNGKELKSFLKEIRKIFPYRSCRALPKKPCLYRDLGLCKAPCVDKRQKKKYQNMIRAMKVFLEIYFDKNKKIEGYDVSNTAGTMAVGSMVVFEKGGSKKSDYRKFKIKRVKGQDDVKSLREIVLRRFRHKEWKMPDLILIDGGKGQLKAVRRVEIPALALAKAGKHSGKLFSLFSKNFVLVDNLPENVRNLLLQARDEAHRFAITYHKERRKKLFAYS